MPQYLIRRGSLGVAHATSPRRRRRARASRRARDAHRARRRRRAPDTIRLHRLTRHQVRLPHRGHAFAKTRRRPGPRRLPRRRHRRRGARASRGRRPPPRTPSRRPRAKALLSTRHHVRHDEPRTVRAVFRRMSRRRGSRQNVPGGDCVCPTPRAASATDAAVVAKHRSRTRSSRPPAVPRAVTAHRREISPRPTRRPFNFFTRRGGDFLRRRRDSNLREFGSVPPLDRPPAARRSRRDGTGPRVRRRAGRCAKGDPLDQRRRDVRHGGRRSLRRRFRTAQGDARRRSRLLGRWNPHGGVDLARVRGSAQRSRGSRRSRRVFPDVLARDVRRDAFRRRRRPRFRESISTRRFSA